MAWRVLSEEDHAGLMVSCGVNGKDGGEGRLEGDDVEETFAARAEILDDGGT